MMSVYDNQNQDNSQMLLVYSALMNLVNGTYDMMGNIDEWMESPWTYGQYQSGSDRGLRGGSYGYACDYLASSYRNGYYFPDYEYFLFGFRVASVPEPAIVVLMSVGVMALLRRNRKA